MSLAIDFTGCVGGVDWNGATKTQRDEAQLAARLFSTPDGQRFFQWLGASTLSDQTPGDYTRGRQSVFFTILAMIETSKNNQAVKVDE